MSLVQTRTTLIQVSMNDFLNAHPRLKYTFFGGKGGVGKTVVAGAAAVGFARRGHRTLLASTNPVHSLSGLLDQDVFGRPTPVEGVPNLWAYEIDTRETIERSKREIREKIQWFLKYAEIRTKADEFVESATMNPAFEESAMFENMIDLMFRDEYDVYVFDTAPTANARRLLGMSSVYALWVNKMMESRREAQSLRKLLSYSKKEEKDPLMDYLIQFKERMDRAKELLTDPERTAFFFVTLPEALPIAVIRRFINWFQEFGIPVGGVVVNMYIDESQIDENAPEFVHNRLAVQRQYMREIEELFGQMGKLVVGKDSEEEGKIPVLTHAGLVRSIIPLYETEVRGVEMLQRVADALFAEPEKVQAS